MIEIRFHGRGGQGAKTAAIILADSALGQGKFIQSFPEYGPERAGAPIRAYTRIDDSLIRIHCSVTDPDVVCVIDPTLLKAVNVAEGLKQDGVVIVNTNETPQSVRDQIGLEHGRVLTVDATKIAFDCVGRNLPNTPMLGAIVKATGVVNIEDLKNSVRKKFQKKIGEDLTNKNLIAIERAFDEVKE